ncbi:hypothetical protein Q9L58_009162 [Maublancomyces gigas]|uniref:Ankyrin repeat domain-containing protein 29 n=1 Tax=Discina gigas TaxID=1032678 RepID=A0ABR3G7N7_9PEZI
MSFQALPWEIVLIVASHLTEEPRHLAALILTNRSLATFLTPTLHSIAVKPYLGTPALVWASSRGHDPLVRLVLASGADVNAVTPTGETALLCAIHTQRPTTARILLESGADANLGGALGLAVRGRNVGITRCLLRHGACVNTIDAGTSPLHRAVFRSRSAPVARVLLEHGANTEALDANGNTALHIAVTTGERMTKKGFVALLLEWGANPDACNRAGETALFAAMDNVCVMHSLIRGGADLNVYNRDGRTPLYVAVTLGRAASVEMLLMGGADVDIPALDGIVPLQLARDHNLKTIIRLFKKYGKA